MFPSSLPPDPPDGPDHAATPRTGVSRRDFLKGLGTTAITAAALSARGVAQELEQANAEKAYGPGPVPVTLSINGERKTFLLEPRVTLLDVLRDHAGLTGAKATCDRATCGACTVLLGDLPVYACSLLAIEAQGAEITTIEGLVKSGELTKLQQAFVDKDGLQCGYCTSGVVMSLTALLRRNPHPTEAEVRKACSGNLCRCGSYPRIFAAALAATGVETASKFHVVPFHDHAVA
jgi:aerobic-type carbon monoxide dehydrogenase small subunit (CoxS/CutS family)